LAQNLQGKLPAPQYNTQNNIYQHGKQFIAAQQGGHHIKKGGIRIKHTVAKRLGQCVAIFSSAATVSIPGSAIKTHHTRIIYDLSICNYI
jgi:hypothetical protein